MTWTKCLSAEARNTLFDVLVHFVWADGCLAHDELAAARGAADALELSPSAVSGQLIARAGSPFESLALACLAPLERPFAYGIAAWISTSDGRVTAPERLLLGRLRRTLGLSSPLAAMVDSWVDDAPRDARDAPEQRLALDRVMSRILGLAIGETRPGRPAVVVCVGCRAADIQELSTWFTVTEVQDSGTLSAALRGCEDGFRAVVLDCRTPNAIASAFFGADSGAVGSATLVLWGGTRVELGATRLQFHAARVIVLDRAASRADVTLVLGRGVR